MSYEDNVNKFLESLLSDINENCEPLHPLTPRIRETYTLMIGVFREVMREYGYNDSKATSIAVDCVCAIPDININHLFFDNDKNKNRLHVFLVGKYSQLLLNTWDLIPNTPKNEPNSSHIKLFINILTKNDLII